LAQPALPLRNGPTVSFRWIIDKRNDLTWYIGSTLVGWLYVGLVLLAVSLLDNPLADAFGVIELGGLHIPITLHLLVYASWAFLLDAPHVWSTLARTFFDPEERRVRRRELLLSWVWFLVGPAAILAPYLLNLALAPLGVALPTSFLGLGAVVLTVFFRIWAYYHVVRQHWGFVSLYKRKNGDMDPEAARVDTWFFNLAFYAPLVMFMTSSIYEQTPGMPPLGLSSLAVGGFSISGAIHLVTWLVFLGAIIYYAAYQFRLWRQGGTLNGPKLLLLAMVIPLHLVAFSNPWLAALVTPIVTVGHNLQYHRIVWMYGQNKYVASADGSRFRAARVIFSRFWVYMGMGLLFTFALYRGPWIEWLESTVGMDLNASVLAGVGMMAGLADPAQMTLGQQLFGGFLLGWAMQHYYLDAKIWRVGRDKAVARQLQVES
jgi:uncharacterized membrane protein (DUF485 family)